MTMHLNRRQILGGSIALAVTAAIPVAAATPASVWTAPRFPFRLAKGSRVPDWVETTTHPGFFGVDVEFRRGGIELYDRVPPEMEPNYAARLKITMISPVSPLKPGECLVRYKGCRMHTLRLIFPSGRALDNNPGPSGIAWAGGPGTVMWVEDEDDVLLQARPFDLAGGKARFLRGL